MRLSCFEPVIIGDILQEDIPTLWDRYKKVRTLTRNEPTKIAAAGINYVDKEISYDKLL